MIFSLSVLPWMLRGTGQYKAREGNSAPLQVHNVPAESSLQVVSTVLHQIYEGGIRAVDCGVQGPS